MRFSWISVITLALVALPVYQSFAANTFPVPPNAALRQILAAPFVGSYTGICISSPDGQKADGTVISVSPDGGQGDGVSVDFTYAKTEISITKQVHQGHAGMAFGAINHRDGTNIGLIYQPGNGDTEYQAIISQRDSHGKTKGVGCRKIPSFVDESFEPLSLVHEYLQTDVSVFNCISPSGQLRKVAVGIKDLILMAGDQQINLSAARNETDMGVHENEKLTLGLIFTDQKQVQMHFKKAGMLESVMYATDSSIVMACSNSR